MLNLKKMQTEDYYCLFVHCSVIYYKLRHKFVKTNNINFDEVFNEDNVKKKTICHSKL